MKGKIVTNASASNTQIRIMVFRDNMVVPDLAPAVTEVLKTAEIQSFRQIDTIPGSRFTVFYDRVFSLDDAKSDSTLFSFNKKYGGHIKWYSNGASDQNKATLYVLILSNQPLNTPTITGEFRLRYVDN